jgi:hypothetical protein
MRAIWFSFAAGLAILGGLSASAEELGAGAPPSGYAEKLAAYQAARASFESEAGPYWQSVADKRRLRNEKRRKNEVVALEDYVLTQPPVYAGPPQPADPDKPGGEQPKADRPLIPVVADFVRNAEEQFGFVPDRPASERDFKNAYAERAKKAGLTRDQVVRIYGFESGGDGKYDVQAGLEYPRPDARPVSTALGYNQLLGTNSVELLAEQGDAFLSALRAKADAAASGGTDLSQKLDILGRMIGFARSVNALQIAVSEITTYRMRRLTCNARTRPQPGKSNSERTANNCLAAIQHDYLLNKNWETSYKPCWAVRDSKSLRMVLAAVRYPAYQSSFVQI